MSHSHWNLQLSPAQHSVNATGFPLLIAKLLGNRGLTETSQVELFITADQRLSGDPFLLTDMHKAVTRIYRALLSGENIAIYGDYDTDGITGTAVLVQGLSNLGGKVTPYIPHRLTEGRGPKIAALENLYRQGVSLVITVDCGITSLNEVKKAKMMGLDIIITDHHIPPPILPPALAVINPKLPNSNYYFSELAGVGVAFKLLQALFQGIGKEQGLDELLDLIALGTVADMVPLLAENRYLVKQGLRLINTAPRLGIREMIKQTGLSLGNIESDSISWTLSPRLNTAGRLQDAIASYKLLMTDSPQEAQKLVAWLEQKNTERQRLMENGLAKARKQLFTQKNSPILLVGSNDYHGGIIGLIAGRLSEEFYRPTVVVKIGEKTSIASCRSIPEFNILLALNQCHDLLTQFGGHAQAAGFTILTSKLPLLKERLLKLATAQLVGVDLFPHLDIDVEVSLADLNLDTFQAIQQLAPFGQGNPLPTFLSRAVKVTDYRTIGNGGEHLKLKLQ
ncbi:single-stranded-DNA-specific exonuclease RecJ, partial [Chloroflexota bacterium]